MWTREKVIGSAPDAASARAGEGLAKPSKWSRLGRSVSCPLPPASLGLAYTWDADNRLVMVATTRQEEVNQQIVCYPGDIQVPFAYDYLGP